MAADTNTGNGNLFLSFIMGALLVAVGIVGFFMWDSYKSQQGAPPAIDLTVKPK